MARKTSPWARLAQLERSAGLKDTYISLRRDGSPQELLAHMLLAARGQKYDVNALAELLDCSTPEAARSVARMQKLHELTPKRRDGADPEEVWDQIQSLLEQHGPGILTDEH